ncbi:MAG: hypothetical protein HON98_07770 [Chloroflexi bacterium]|nr:hypothetical protein [Chloroflexota bacterium]MBT3669842.1 hypothetical protein [Chloroflexota bacterium]MBT4002854.1 hypothetical protein [Chloroflexota bacterium]MBT4304743.1 hypothetical protein [Chloroflexota bacterium]MBT4534755.1 hypothetical protein [Chloroflexota bacterium]
MKFISGVFKFLAVIIMIFVIIFLPLSLFARNVGEVLFSQDMISELIEKNLFDEEILANLAQDLISSNPITSELTDDTSAVSEFVNGALKNLNIDQWTELISTITPTDLMSDTFSSIFDEFYIWMDNDEPVPNIVIDLTPWKRNTIQNSSKVLDLVLNVLPACTSDQISTYALNSAANFFGGSASNSVPLCKPSEPYYSLLVEKGTVAIPSIAGKLPDEVNLADQLGAASFNLVILKQTLKSARFLLQWSWIIVLILFLVAIPMGARTISQTFKWAGWPLFFSGGFLFVLVFSLDFISTRLISFMGNLFFADVPETIGGFLESILAILMTFFAFPLKNQGLIVFVVGLISLMIGYILYSMMDNKKNLVPATPVSPAPATENNVLTDPLETTETIPSEVDAVEDKIPPVE